jgi:hypothetical protein
MRTMRSAIAMAVALGATASVAGAATIEGGVAGLKLILLDKYSLGKAKAVYVAKGDPDIVKGMEGDPPGLTGNVQIVDLSDPANRAVYDLAAVGWLVNKSTVAKYVNKTAAPGGAGVKVAVVKPGLVGKVVAKNLGDGDAASGDQGSSDLNLQAFDGSESIRVIVTVNNANDGNTYKFCSDFSALAVKLDNASQPFKVISKTSTATVGPCDVPLPCNCGSASGSLLFTNSLGVGDCGATLDSSGATIQNLACGSLYIGGGGSTIPPPISPDYGAQVYSTSCSGSTLTVGPTTAGDTGSNLNCTSVGCFYGAPLPIVNPLAVLSTCVLNVVATDASGSAVCTAGSADIDIPLTSIVRLAGDILAGTTCVGGPTPGAACTTHSSCGDGGYCANGTQPCPVCTQDSTSGTGFRCHGGTNDLGSCTPGSSEYSPAAPTSHDCPPAQPILGSLPIPYALTTGTAQKTAVDQPSLPRVFCGFCFDGSAFENPAHSCNSDADCTNGAFTECRQRNSGAFPGGGAARTVTENGSPGGDLTDNAPHAATLATVFCIPPTFNGTIDSSADLPGPGATSLPGTVQLAP